MQGISIECGYADTGSESPEVEELQVITNKLWVIPMKIRHPKRSIQGPVIAFHPCN